MDTFELSTTLRDWAVSTGLQEAGCFGLNNFRTETVLNVFLSVRIKHLSPSHLEQSLAQATHRNTIAMQSKDEDFTFKCRTAQRAAVSSALRIQTKSDVFDEDELSSFLSGLILYRNTSAYHNYEYYSHFTLQKEWKKCYQLATVEFIWDI